MGLFDFLKPKKDPLERFRQMPEFRPVLIEAQMVNLVAQCNNLKAVGREGEAKQIAVKFLIGLVKDCMQKEFWESSFMLSALASAAIRFGEPKHGRELLGKIIDFHVNLRTKGVQNGPALDLTQAYIDAGRLAHQARESREDEYQCFWEAAETQPPPGCKNPASNRQKAMAHNFAYSLCATEVHSDPANQSYWSEREAWHDAKRREFAPECNWEDALESMKYLLGGE